MTVITILLMWTGAFTVGAMIGLHDKKHRG